jgi:hypothetical protein
MGKIIQYLLDSMHKIAVYLGIKELFEDATTNVDVENIASNVSETIAEIQENIEEVKEQIVIEVSNIVNPQYNKDTMIEIATNGPLTDLEDMPDSLKKDVELFKILVKINGTAISYAHDSIKDNEEIVQLALKQSPDFSVMQHVSERLRSNKDIMAYALQKNGSLYKYLCGDLKLDKDIILNSVNYCSPIIWHMPDKILEDKNFILDLMYHNNDLSRFIRHNIKDNTDYIKLTEIFTLAGNYSRKYKNTSLETLLNELINSGDIDDKCITYLKNNLDKIDDIIKNNNFNYNYLSENYLRDKYNINTNKQLEII